MKRLTSLLLAFMLVLSLAACGEESTPNIDDGASQSQSENTSPDSAGQTSNSSSDEVSTSNIDDKANQALKAGTKTKVLQKQSSLFDRINDYLSSIGEDGIDFN